MKTLPSLISLNRWNLFIGGLISFFAVCLLCDPQNPLFENGKNEFFSVLWLCVALFFLSLGMLAGILHKRKTGRIWTFWLIFLLAAGVFVFLQNTESAFLYPDLPKIPFCCLSGWLLAGCNNCIFRKINFLRSCFAGCATGFALNRAIAEFPFFFRNFQQFLPPAAVIFLGIVFILAIRILHRKKFAVQVLLSVAAVIFFLYAGYCFYRVQTCGFIYSFTMPDHQLPLTAQSGLQPNRKAIRILQISEQEQAEGLKLFPLTRKLVHLPLQSPDGQDIFRRLDRLSENFDLIVLLPPFPDTLAAGRFYTPEFFELLKKHLAPGGVAAIRLFGDSTAEKIRKERLLDIYGIVSATLRRVYRTVKPATDNNFILLCGEENVTNLPKELDARARELLADHDYLPDGLFLLMNTEEELTARDHSILEHVIRSECNEGFPPPLLRAVFQGQPELDQTFRGKLAEYLMEHLLRICIIVFSAVLILRYLYSGGTVRKRCCLSLENGFFAGILLFLLGLALQRAAGRLPQDWALLTGLFFLASLLGTFPENCPPFRLKCFLLLALLLPVAGTVMLYGKYQPDCLQLYLTTFFTGYVFGQEAGAIRANYGALLFGLAAGLFLCVLLFWTPGGLIFAAVLAGLTKIPPLSAENLQKEFDKRKIASTI